MVEEVEQTLEGSATSCLAGGVGAEAGCPFRQGEKGLLQG